MSSADKHSKTEKPTQQKLRKAREEGQVARSAELGSWVAICVASLVLPLYVKLLLNEAAELFSILSALRTETTQEVLPAVGKKVVSTVALLVAIPLSAALIVGVGSSLAQTGFVFSPKKVIPKASNLSWKQGFKKVLSKKSAWETGKQLARLSAVAAVCIPVVKSTITGLAAPGVGLTAGFSLLTSRLALMLQLVAATGLVLSLIDFAFQKKATMKELMMTKQEVKQESKNSEGDPLLKGKRRQLQMELSQNRMLASVSEATVVVVNPVHFAVALHYDPAVGAPVVVSKGAEEKAISIRDEALAAGVPVVECVPLARRLHKDCKKGSVVPTALFSAVAVLIAFTRQLGNKSSLPIVHQMPSHNLDLDETA